MISTFYNFDIECLPVPFRVLDAVGERPLRFWQVINERRSVGVMADLVSGH